jgi:U3 small nucleolar RNA-associated protein 3
MGKKRKAAQPAGPSGPREVDPAEARLTINTFEDVADSEDEYFINKDRIDFDDDEDAPKSKRLRRIEKEEASFELSDEEILRDEDSEDDDEEETPKPAKKSTSKRGKPADASEDEEDDRAAGEDEEDSGWWGSSRKEYYDADNIEREADALEEEAEARRLQKKKLAKMSEADFMFDENEWLAPTADGGEEAGLGVVEVLRAAEIAEDMTPQDRYKLLQARYPEFDYLVEEFQALQPVLASVQKDAEGKPTKSLEVVRYWVLGSYIASLAGYFAILTSPARDKQGVQQALDPAELRDHDVMETLVQCREVWTKVNKLSSSKRHSASDTGMLSPPEDDDLSGAAELEVAELKKATKDSKVKKKAAAEKARRAQAIEDSLADLSDLLRKPKQVTGSNKAGSSAVVPGQDDDEDNDKRSDFGEEDALDELAAADKAKRKKSLRFYTSQIVQKANRRVGAGRDAGGDTDIPYRERLRDRQARLNAEAERRGQKGSKHGADLGDESGDDEDGVADQMRDDADEYYDMVAMASKKKKADKAAVAASGKGQRIVPVEVVGEDGKRKITYAIEKNKGLTPRRKKDVRNPRVKKRKRYAEQQKKLRSMRPVYGGGEGAGYQGELSGIKTGLVKSVKL